MTDQNVLPDPMTTKQAHTALGCSRNTFRARVVAGGHKPVDQIPAGATGAQLWSVATVTQIANEMGRTITAASSPTYVYVASSWRNPMQPVICTMLKSCGIEHYDFRNPESGPGFSWRPVSPDGAPDGIAAKGSDWEAADTYLDMVHHPVATLGFTTDFDAMQRADTFVMVLPCGKSAHLELGWAVGAGKRTIILLEDPVEPELMYRMVDEMVISSFDLMTALGVDQ